MISKSLSYAGNGHRPPFFWPAGISLAAHLILLGVIIYCPSWHSEPDFVSSVIDVQMVDVPDLGTVPAPKNDLSKEKASVVEKKETEVVKESVSKPETEKKPEISVAAPPKKKSKNALKYKTFKSKKVIKNALKRVEKKIDSSPPKPLEDTIKRLREKVAKQGRPGPSDDRAQQSDKPGKSDVYGHGRKKEIELVELYRVEIALMIQKNWAFAAQLSGGGKKLMASIVFKIMPDGEIKDIFFTEHSGNQHLDESGYKAIVKSSPVRPHPEKLSLPYVEMGLRFTPEGIR